MRNWLKTLLFVSAFSPTLFALAGVRWYSKGLDTLVWQLMIISVLGTVLPFLILKWVKNETERIRFSAKKVEPADHYLLVFLGSYTAPVIMKMAEINFSIMVIVLVMLFVVTWIISYIPSHPALYCLKYRFYKAESKSGMVYTLISSRKIVNPSQITSVYQISNGMLME